MKAKVLIVDDDPAIRRVLRRVLENGGHQVLEAEDGNRVLDLARTERFSMVLLDLHMPRLDGIATLSHIRDIDPDVPVIMITGDGNNKRVPLAAERGACEFLTKPFDLEVLRSLVSVHARAAA